MKFDRNIGRGAMKKERFDERLAICCDGGEPTWQMDRIARMEARMVHIHTVAEPVCNGAVSFGMGLKCSSPARNVHLD